MSNPRLPRLARFMLVTALTLAGLHISARSADAFAYVFAGDNFGLDTVTHPFGYDGTNGIVNLTVGIDPTSAYRTEMVTSVQNVVRTWNALVPTTGNLSVDAVSLGGTIPDGAYDFESVLLHEMGHALGLSHPNLGVQASVSGANTDFTQSTAGADGNFSFDAGPDGIIGSADDVRGDDGNLNWFKKDSNDPFEIAGTVDSSTYSRDPADLPPGDAYSANPSRDVADELGYANTEAVLQQGTPNNEVQRELGHDDVAGILYAMSGFDEIAGTADDYLINLIFEGETTDADIVIDFDNAETGFAVTKFSHLNLYSGGSVHGPHAVPLYTEGYGYIPIFFNDDGIEWYFNDVPNAAVPEPASLAMMGLAVCGAAGLRRRRRQSERGGSPSA